MSKHNELCFSHGGLDLLNPLTQVCICDRLLEAELRGVEKQQEVEARRKIDSFMEGYEWGLNKSIIRLGDLIKKLQEERDANTGPDDSSTLAE